MEYVNKKLSSSAFGSKHLCAATLLVFASLAVSPAYPQTSSPIGDAVKTLGNIFGTNPPTAPAGVTTQQGLNMAEQAMAAAPVSGSYRALFAKGTVNGEDLYETLKAMRLELQAKRTAKAWAKLALVADRTLTAQALSSGVDFGKILQDVVMSTAIESLKNFTIGVAMKTLDEYLQYLLEERRGALAEETITLPSVNGMTDAQAKRTITMATLIVAARLSGKILDKADQDFKSLAVDYKSLLDQREKAANLLFATVDQRRAAASANDGAKKEGAESDLRTSLSEKDLAFIDASFSRMTLKEFAKDMAAQNLALQYMQSKNPQAFKEYRTKADDVVRRTNGYVRTVSGVAAFGGILMSFGQEIADTGRDNNINSLLLSMPLGVEFLTAVAPVVKKSVQVAYSGVSMPLSSGGFLTTIFDSKRTFTVSRTGKTEEVRSSTEVFKSVQDAGVSGEFVGALFSDSPGWLSRVRQCDPIETGRMLDAALDKAERSKFATDYFAWPEPEKVSDFSFMNAFSQPGNTRKERELGNDLLGKDHRRSSDALPLAEIQLAVERKYAKWSDQDLLRLIFTNRESGAAYANLDIGEVSIKPLPTPEAVYAYESRVEACRKIEPEPIQAVIPTTNTVADKATETINKVNGAAGKVTKPIRPTKPPVRTPAPQPR